MVTHSVEVVHRAGGQEGGKGDTRVADGVKQLVLAVATEGGLPCDHFVGQHPQGPPVD